MHRKAKSAQFRITYRRYIRRGSRSETLRMSLRIPKARQLH